jgi:hypothetical protein
MGSAATPGRLARRQERRERPGSKARVKRLRLPLEHSGKRNCSLLCRAARHADIALAFFAGHGLQHNGRPASAR